MKQAIFTRFGQPSRVIECANVPDLKEPSDWEVCVDVMVTTVNPSDVSVLRGQYGRLPSTFPATPGLEGAGRVVSVGKSVKDFSTGDNVILICNNNWVQRKNVPATSLFRMPDWLSLEQAALVKVNAGCALHMLNTFGNLQAGDHMILNAPMSAVGQMLISFAAEKGFKTVCVVRREEAVKETLEFGADHVVVAGENLGKTVSEVTGGVSIKVAFDAVAGESTAQLGDCLDVGGTLVNYGMLSGQSCQIRPDQTIFRDLHICGFWLLKELKNLKLRERRGLLEETLQLMEKQNATNAVHARFPLEQISDAIEASEAAERTGKVLILPNGPVD
ncbi:MAG: zinc-dependent alcohol dehydrogenase family protein [Granulosicoccus sp.]